MIDWEKNNHDNCSDNNKDNNKNNDNNVEDMPVQEGWVGLRGQCLVGWTGLQPAVVPVIASIKHQHEESPLVSEEDIRRQWQKIYGLYYKKGSYLDVASELSSGIKAALRVLAESKSCLSAQTDTVSVAIVDST